MPRCETTRDQYGKEALSFDFEREQGSNVFVAQRPLTKGAVLCAIGDTDILDDVRKSGGRSLYDKPPIGRR